MKKLLILDSHALIHRSFYAVRELSLRDGTPINAVYGFARVLLQIIEKMNPDYFAVVKDMPGKTFRHKQFDGYKATRQKAPQELYDQIPLVYELVSGFHIPVIGLEGFEADDLAGTISKSKNIPNNIHRYLITGDFDYLQLVDDLTTVIHFKKGFTETKTYDQQGVRTYYGLTIDQVLDYKALVGDSSDNLPGVRGVGPKTAQKLISEYKSLDKIYENLDSVSGRAQDLLRENKENAYMTKSLSKIKCDIDIEIDISHMKFDLNESLNDIEKTFQKFEFNLLSAKLDRMMNKNQITNIQNIFKEDKKNNPSQGSLF